MGTTHININEVDPVREEREGNVREVGSHAIWSLSSCKPSFGVDQLRDNCMETYWQSDGQLPHLVNIQFRKKTTVQDICIYIDYKSDESYTPSRISVRAGTNFTDLQEVEVIDLNEPTGWFVIPIKDIHDQPIRTFMIQIAVISNHQNGRDTHMRQIKIHSPMEKRGNSVDDIGDFSTQFCQMYHSLRYFVFGVVLDLRQLRIDSTCSIGSSKLSVPFFTVVVSVTIGVHYNILSSTPDVVFFFNRLLVSPSVYSRTFKSIQAFALEKMNTQFQNVK